MQYGYTNIEIPSKEDWERINGTIPSKANEYKIGRYGASNGVMGNHIIKSGKIRAYERNFAKQCTKYRNRNISVPFAIFVRVFYPDGVHDLDNALKTLLDCLQYNKAIVNDNLCRCIQAERYRDKIEPRVEYAIKPLQPTNEVLF